MATEISRAVYDDDGSVSRTPRGDFAERAVGVLRSSAVRFVLVSGRCLPTIGRRG